MKFLLSFHQTPHENVCWKVTHVSPADHAGLVSFDHTYLKKCSSKPAVQASASVCRATQGPYLS